MPANTRPANSGRRGVPSRGSTALGVSAAAAYSMIGLSPAMAQSGRETAPDGRGTLRIQQEVRALKDPRTL